MIFKNIETHNQKKYDFRKHRKQGKKKNLFFTWADERRLSSPTKRPTTESQETDILGLKRPERTFMELEPVRSMSGIRPSPRNSKTQTPVGPALMNTPKKLDLGWANLADWWIFWVVVRR
jgi:hypothetical protein